MNLSQSSLFARRAVLLVVVAILSALLGSSSVAAPVIACSNPVRDFGRSTSSNNIVFEYVIANAGDAPLTIGNIRACCGASAAIDSKEIAPGTSSVLRVDLSLKGRSGRLVKTIYVASNDPVRPYFQIRMEGEVVREFDVSPKAVSFSGIAGNVAATQVVEVVCRDDMLVVFTNAACASPFFAVTFDRRATNSCSVSVRTVPPLDSGVLRAEVILRTSSAAFPEIRIPLTASVVSNVTVVPRTIDLVADWRQQPVTRFVAVRFAPGASCNVLRATAPEGITASVTAIPGGGSVKLSGIVPGLELDGKYVEVETDNPGMPSFRIPFRIVAPGLATGID